jgi:hypothetical protein
MQKRHVGHPKECDPWPVLRDPVRGRLTLGVVLVRVELGRSHSSVEDGPETVEAEDGDEHGDGDGQWPSG